MGRLAVKEIGEIEDAEVLAILERAERQSAPKPAWYLVLAHSPEMAKAYAAYWDTTHRGGAVEHKTKELMRILVADLLDCAFCSQQRSTQALAEGLQEEEVQACTLPQMYHPDPKVRAALALARAMVQDAPPQECDRVYEELKQHYTPGEIVELGCFAAIAIGGVKLSRTLSVEH